ncbi:ABC transporter ATP-binding protein [Bythopirellula goksoeyrii]|uniref:Putative ABC transporter ATP-binding protein YlmA n=1 Tax=Bythopirellula goksoeyrii TaxID=1400387 RepID=A0A5B9QHY3_9BACT|nr:ATP-binding cassette domain-containing protein [Bythopirellula goksoeyrii]QEG37225.1 putative ABC transporter ATP-binding protein YlmA [Bythopirellula goksoeyrii]
MSQDKAIEFKDVSFRTTKVEILRDVNWSINRGAMAVILGPNGCGKTTLLRLITGYLWPSEGSVATLGCELGSVDVHSLRRRLGIVDPSAVALLDANMTALDVVLTGFFGTLTIYFDRPTRTQVEIARKAMHEVGLFEKDNQNFQTLSTGEQRRILLARAMVGRPEMLILDEACAGLDLLSRETLLATVWKMHSARPDMTLLVVTHHIEEVLPTATDVLLMREGKIVGSGSPNELLTNEPVSKAFGCAVEVSRIGERWTWSVTPEIWEGLLSGGKAT